MIDGELELGALVAFNAFVVLLVWPLRMLGWIVAMRWRDRPSAPDRAVRGRWVDNRPFYHPGPRSPVAPGSWPALPVPRARSSRNCVTNAASRPAAIASRRPAASHR